MDYRKESLRLHGEWKGKIEVNARAKVNDKDSLSLAYTPGVAEPCLAIKDDYKELGAYKTLEYGSRYYRRNCCFGPWRYRP